MSLSGAGEAEAKNEVGLGDVAWQLKVSDSSIPHWSGDALVAVEGRTATGASRLQLHPD